jgi:hypothetical protein
VAGSFPSGRRPFDRHRDITQLERKYMKRILAVTAVAALGAAATFAEVNVQPGDIAFGISNASEAITLEHVRAPGLIGQWSVFGNIQSTEFDNAGGILHNNNGNLLALDFGGSNGGALYNFSTNGSNAGQLLVQFDGNGGNPLTRVTGLSVSPDNTKVAVYAANSGRVLIYNYSAGTAGTGAGASASFLRQSDVVGNVTATQSCGTAWLDNNTIVIFSPNDGTTGSVNRLHTIDASTGVATLRATFIVSGSGNRFSEVEYNPEIAPGLLFATVGRNASGVTTNTMIVYDATTFAQIDTVDYSTGADTFREIAFGPNKRLYVGAFGSKILELALDANGDSLITAADIPLIPDNSATLAYSGVTSSSFNGLDVALGTADPTGACCISESNCQQTTDADCAMLGGEYRGAGTNCSTPNVCAPLTGACCITGTGCLSLTEADCLSQMGEYQGDNTTCTATACFLREQPVEAGDLALGLSNSVPFLSSWLVRNGQIVGAWTDYGFLQSMEFDNASGVLHNAAGNLLALDYGSGGADGGAPTCGDPLRPQEGGGIYQLSTDGTEATSLLYKFNMTANPSAVACTRVSGLAVSPDNMYVSVVGVDTADVYVLQYNAGSAIGSGTGASIGAAYTLSGVAFAGMTQGTTWFDEDTLLVATPDPFGDPFRITLQVVDFNGSTFGSPVYVDVDLPNNLSGSRFTDVEYNPEVSPFIYMSASGFSSGTINFLAIINPTGPNPATWTVVKVLDLGKSLQTCREIALGPDGRLYLGEFAQGGSPQLYVDALDLDLNDDGEITLAETLALTDNSTVDYFAALGGPGASFSGLDVAFASADPCDGVICGDSNLSGTISVGDIGAFVTAVSQGFAAWDALLPGTQTMEQFICANDTDGGGTVSVGDIGRFVASVTAGTSQCQ